MLKKNNELSNFFMTSKCERPNHLVNVACQSEFVFCLFNVFFRFRRQSAKKKCLRFAIFNFSEKLQNLSEIGLKKKIWIDRTKIALEKRYLQITNSQTRFYFF